MVAPGNVPASYGVANGFSFTAIINIACGTAATVAPGTLTPAPIYVGQRPTQVGDFIANDIVTFLFDAVSGVFRANVVGAGKSSVFPSLAALSTLTRAQMAATGFFIVQGFASPGDGGDANFLWSPGSTAMVDGGLVIGASDGGTGRAIRVLRPDAALVPTMWGAKGDGSTVDTAPIVACFTAANSSGRKIDGGGLAYLVSGGAIPSITVSNLTIQNIGLKKTGNSDGNLLTLSCAYPVLRNVVIDGNQAADSVARSDGSCGIYLNCTNPTFYDVLVKNVNGVGVDSNPFVVTHGLFVNLQTTANASAGIQLYGASYCDFYGYRTEMNGFGFQRTKAYVTDYSQTQFAAFGAVLRLRCHHLNFFGGAARLNGRDGFNINQGSYQIKLHGFIANDNDDGGITLAADNTGSGLPGEGESCWDTSLIDCEAVNNYGSGVAAYQAMYNVTIRGGRYYNNHRNAGRIANQSSYQNGIYIAAGSTGVQIDGANCYDDRRVGNVSNIGSNPVFTVTNYQFGLLQNYNTVGIWDSTGQTFRGYCTVTAENSGGGTVTLTPTAFNFCPLANIQIGDRISMAIQHAGVFPDNATSGEVRNLRGYGHTVGPLGGFGGRNIVAGNTANGTTGVFVYGKVVGPELMLNPSFDTGIANWTLGANGGTGTATPVTSSATCRSPGGVQLVGGTMGAAMDGATITNAVEAAAGSFVQAGMWCQCSTPGAAQILFFFGTNPWAVSATHPGDGTWQYLAVSAYFPPGTTTGSCFLRLSVAAGATANFDTGASIPTDCPVDLVSPSRYLAA